MKKSLFILAAAAVALASCSNDEVVSQNTTENQPKEIAFAPLAQKATRAAADTYQYAIDGTTFPTDLNMYVAAYQVEPTATNYFAGTQFIYDNAGGTGASSGYWGGATAKYWPLSPCYINFLAYANVTGSAAFNGSNYASAAVITQTDNSSAQTDLMYATGNGEVTQSGNALTFPANVPMEFKHAQAWISFNVKAASSVETAITINSITLNGAKYAGTYTITYSNYNAKAAASVSGAWSSLGAAKNQLVAGISSQALTTSFAAAGANGIMIVPDDAATGDFTSFTINYTYDSKTYDYTFTPVNTNVDQGKHYIYNITFTLHEIFVSATVEDWADQTVNYVDVPTQAFKYADSGSGDFNIPATAGKYTFTITDLPAGTYTVEEGTSGTDFIPDGGITTSDLIVAADGSINVTVEVSASAGNQRPIELKLSGTTKFTVNVKQGA